MSPSAECVRKDTPVLPWFPRLARRSWTLIVCAAFVLCASYVLLGMHSSGEILHHTLSIGRNQTTKVRSKQDNQPESAIETALTLYPKIDLSTSDHVMLIHIYNPSPNSEHRLSFKGCQYRCSLTNDSQTADLIYFNAGRMFPSIRLPVTRRKNQSWLLYSREPPTFSRFKHLTRPDLRGQINWTRAIFSDATFPLVYGVLMPRGPPDFDFDAIFDSKKFDVAWFVGHCNTQSRREEYVRRMTSRIGVHIYGICGNLTCGVRGYNMGGYKTRCLRMLSNNYKFYLAFENSLCDNYVTEKFFNLFQTDEPVHVIPVVRGGADYRRLFDPDIYVDASEFPSPESLADYLHSLARDKTRYVAMLKRKSRYTLGRPPEKFECSMCKALHTRELDRQPYGDIHSFWTQADRCRLPTDLT